MKEQKLGFIESGYNRNDRVYNSTSNYIPQTYRVKDTLKVFNQGNKGSCVSCSVAEMYNFYCLSNNKKSDIDFEYLYYKRSNKSIDGMTPREAFEILKKENKISGYAKINSLNTLKHSLIANGQVLIGLPVKSYNDDFWKGSELIGGHAVAIVGYDENGFIIKNSWGTEYANAGYNTLPYSDFNKVYEAWTILSIIAQ